MESTLLSLLVCPTTRQPLRLATKGELLALEVDAALVREDGRVAYPIQNGIPVLIAESAISF